MKMPVEQHESFDQFSERRWNEMQSAWRDGRPYKERGWTVKRIVAEIRREYYKKLH
jgi:hypothetical protein